MELSRPPLTIPAGHALLEYRGKLYLGDHVEQVHSYEVVRDDDSYDAAYEADRRNSLSLSGTCRRCWPDGVGGVYY